MTVITDLLKLFNAAGGPLQQLTTTASWTTSATTLAISGAVPSWVVAGMNVYDVTKGANIGTVSGSTSTTLTLSAAASAASSGAADVIQLGLTPSDLAVAAAAGCDVRGILEVCQIKANEIDQLMSYLETDVITSSQDSAANTLLAAIVTALA